MVDTVVLSLILVFTSLTICRAELPERPPATIIFSESSFGPHFLPGGGAGITTWSTVRLAGDKWGAYLRVGYRHDPDWKLLLKRGRVDYPVFAEGDILPLFHQIYQVAEIEQAPGEVARMRFVRLDDLTAKYAIRPDSWVLPIGFRTTKGGGAQQHEEITFKTLDTATEPTKPRAVFRIRWQNPPGVIVEKEIEVSPGSIVTLGKLPARVRNIVPPDPMTGIVGWIEFEEPKE